MTGGRPLLDMRQARIAFACALLASTSLAQRPPQGAAEVLSGEEELKLFEVAPGFEVELVASDPNMNKVVDIAFDDAGRMWAVTALEYPLDANESEGVAELYARGGRDQVLVFDEPWSEGPQTPRVFAEGLFMPMAILPETGSVLVGQGPDILRFFDDDRDGRADRREVVLAGFGIQDSHLMPHRFVRAPGGWIYLAQGAFNSSRVETKRGEVVTFNKCKLGRFQADGSQFEVVGIGLNNIWGFVLDRAGDKWIQEANDQGYPVVPFEHGMSYPGIGGERFHDYSPWRPSLAEFQVGGTGLSGLALSQDQSGFPAPWNETHFLANPIINKVQSIRVTRDAAQPSKLSLAQAPDLLVSKDANFRPIAIHFGPDGCLYIVDWYNPIISHNEVPRDHPARDRISSRIWRIRHETQARRRPIDVAGAATGELVQLLRSDFTLTARAAWHQIADRRAVELERELNALALDDSAKAEDRLLACWCLGDLGRVRSDLVITLLRSPHASLRKEAARHLHSSLVTAQFVLEHDSRVRVVAIEALRHEPGFDALSAGTLLKLLRKPVQGETVRLSQIGDVVNSGLAGDIDFERSLIREALAEHPGLALEIYDEISASGETLASEAELHFLLICAGGDASAVRLAESLSRLEREPNAEEFALLAEHVEDAQVFSAVTRWLRESQTRRAALQLLIDSVGRWDRSALATDIVESLRALVRDEPSPESHALLLRFAQLARLKELESDVIELYAEGHADRSACLRALVELDCQDADLYFEIASSSLPGTESRRFATSALASVRTAQAFDLLLELWPTLEKPTRNAAVSALLAHRDGAQRLVRAIAVEDIGIDALDAAALTRLESHLGETPELSELRTRVAGAAVPVLRLGGEGADYADTNIELAGAFTCEAWIKLDAGITNADGLLAGEGVFDFNFHDARPRLYLGPKRGDVLIAKRQVQVGVWTHVALTRSETGQFALFMDGELDCVSTQAVADTFDKLDVARTTPGPGTSGSISEFRLWRGARTAAQIGGSFRRKLSKSAGGADLLLLLPGDNVTLSGAAQIEGALDAPPIQTDEEALLELERFAKYRAHAELGGDATRGREVFTTNCASCHRVGGVGGSIGPTLDGAASKGVEGLLRAILTPNAGVESGYRTLLVRTASGELLDGFLASENSEAIVLRRRDREDLTLLRDEIVQARFDSLSLMPEGLLEALAEADVRDLFAYLLSIR